MKRWVVASVLLVAIVVTALAVWWTMKDGVRTVVETRRAPAPRVVTETWPFDRFSPGHSEHVLNRHLPCNACHDPTRNDFEGVDMGSCTSCHEDQAAIAHMGSEKHPTQCFDCHTFKASDTTEGPWECVRCHGPFDATTHEGLAMHNTIACANCHNPHRLTEETVAECTDCHSDIDLRHGQVDSRSACTDCHGGHDLATDATACLQCHNSRQHAVAAVPATATFGGGHDSCASCHEAHQFSAADAVRCESCHADTHALAAQSSRAHADCRSCHEPHAVQRAGDGSCRGCHGDVAASHPETDGQRCTSCHAPHPEKKGELVMACSDCHAEATSEAAFHAGNTRCTDCHTPHGFDLGSVTEGELCTQCHRDQVRLTSRNAGHETCASCHQGNAHHVGETTGCETCHQAVLAVSPLGHQECASCHEPHGGGISSGQQCTTCHAVTELPGLHRIPIGPDDLGHSECTACHSTHAMRARAGRSACATCHQGIESHEPDAKRCTGCHTFIRSGR
ncbi:MAG: cytochrome c3 family protein [Myxococcota bacterium]